MVHRPCLKVYRINSSVLKKSDLIVSIWNWWSWSLWWIFVSTSPSGLTISKSMFSKWPPAAQESGTCNCNESHIFRQLNYMQINHLEFYKRFEKTTSDAILKILLTVENSCLKTVLFSNTTDMDATPWNKQIRPWEEKI